MRFRNTGEQPVEDQTYLADVETQIRQELDAIYSQIPDPFALANPRFEADMQGQQVYLSMAQRLAAASALDPRKRGRTEDDYLEVAMNMDRNERSRRVVGHATKLAEQGALTPDHVRFLAEKFAPHAGALQPTRTTREQLASDTLATFVRSLDVDPLTADATKRKAQVQLNHLHDAIDATPSEDRTFIKKVASVVAQNDRKPGAPLSPHEVSALRLSSPRRMGQRNPGSRDDMTRRELEDILGRRAEQPGVPLARKNDLNSLRNCLSRDGLPIATFLEDKQAPKPEPPKEPASLARRAVAGAAAAGIAGTGGLGLALAGPAQAAPNRAPVSAVTPLQNLLLASADKTVPSAPTPEPKSFTIELPPTSTVEPVPLSPVPKTLPKLNIAPPPNPLILNQNIIPVGTPLVGNTPPAFTIDMHAPATAPKTATPNLPAEPVVPTIRIIAPNIVGPSVLAGGRSSDTLGKSANTPITAQTRAITISTDSLNIPLNAPANTAPSTATTAAVSPTPEQAQQASASAMDVYNQMTQQGAPLDQRVQQLLSAQTAAGNAPAPFGAAATAVQNQASLLEAKMLNTPNIDPKVAQQIRQILDASVVQIAAPASNTPSAGLIDTKDDIYVNADAQAVYANTSTYLAGDATDSDVQAQLNQVDPSTWSTVSKLLASADALLQTPEQQVTTLQGINPEAAKSLSDRLAQLAKTALINTPQPTKPAPAQPAPAPAPVQPKASHQPTHPAHTKNKAPAVPEHLTAHQLDLAAADAMIKLGGEWTNRGIAMKTMLASGDINAIAASGVTGNFMEESGLNPHNVQNGCRNDSPTLPDGIGDVCGYGIGQWTTAGRQDALRRFAAAHGGSTGDLNIQILFSIHELTGAYSDTLAKLNSATDASQAAYIARVHYESPDPKVAMDSVREAGAMKVYRQFQHLRNAIVAQQHEAQAKARQAALDVSNLTKPAAGPFEYIMDVPSNGHASGHDIYYSNQGTDILKGMDSESACGVYAIGMIYASLTQQPNAAAIQKVETALEKAGAYANGPGMLDSHKMLAVIRSLGMNVRTVQFERSAPELSDNDLAQIRQAFDQNKQGKPTLVLFHTSKLVSEVLGQTPGNATDGHFLAGYAASNNNFFVANPGERADSPKKGHAISASDMKNWLDGAYVIELPKK